MTNNLETNNISAAAKKTRNGFCILECVCMAACFLRVGAALRNDLAPHTLRSPQMPRSLHWGEDRVRACVRAYVRACVRACVR